MTSRLPVIDDDGEVGDLSKVDPALFKPAAEVLSPSLLKKLGLRGTQKAPTKVPTTIRFDADVLAALKASGKGWQTRVNEAVREWLKSHSSA